MTVSVGRSVVLAFVSAAGLANGAQARAAPPVDDAPTVRLEWTAPSACIAGGDLDRAVSAQLGRPAFSSSRDAELVARGRVEPSAGGRYRAEVTLSTRGEEPLGTRTLDSDTPDCHSLDEAMAVMLAIMLNVHRADVPELAREAPATPPPATSEPESASPAWSPRVAASAGVVTGLLPRAGPETAVGVTLRLGRRFEVGFEVAGDWAVTAPAAEGSLRVAAATARVVAMPLLLERGRTALWLRLAAGAGPMWAQASGFAQVFTERRAWADGRAGLQAAVRVAGLLWATVGAEVGFVPLRPVFAVRNGDGTDEPLFQPRSVTGAVLVGLAFRRPP